MYTIRSRMWLPRASVASEQVKKVFIEEPVRNTSISGQKMRALEFAGIWGCVIHDLVSLSCKL